MPTTDPDHLAATFKAYDVRGTVPDQVDEDLARAVGNAFVALSGVDAVVVGHDMRPSSPGMSRAFAEGAARAGADVALIGLASTDELYFASGHLDRPGAMFTASHNPARYNGIKLCRAGAAPVGMETGLAEIRDRVASGELATADRAGSISEQDVLADYADHLPGPGAGAAAAAEGGRRRRQRDGRTHRACGAGPARRRRRRPLLRARRHLPEPRGQPDRAGEPGRPPGGGARDTAPTSGWPSTATPTAASWSTSAASWSARAP